MKIGFGSDKPGFELKQYLMKYLKAKGHEVIDESSDSSQIADYPLSAFRVAQGILSGKYERGILICGTGQGMMLAANKVPGIRAGLCHDIFTTIMSREHNNSNVLCMGGWIIKPGDAERIVDTWLFMAFAGGVHEDRLKMIEDIEAGINLMKNDKK